MNVYASLHPQANTALRIARSGADSAHFFRALVIGECSIMPVSAEQARAMAAILDAIAVEMEREEGEA